MQIISLLWMEEMLTELRGWKYELDYGQVIDDYVLWFVCSFQAACGALCPSHLSVVEGTLTYFGKCPCLPSYK